MAVLGMDSSRPSRPTTNLNVDAFGEFGEFRCGTAKETSKHVKVEGEI